MSKKIALITGANKGIGFETARQLGKEGVTIIAAARNKERGIKAVEQLKAEGIEAEFLQLDVDNHADIQNAFDYINTKYGKLDILINNAGVQLESSGWGINNTAEISDKALHDTLNTNFFNVVKLTNTLLPLIRKSEAGRIVNLSSILGSLNLHSDPSSPIYSSKLFAYDTSKTALNAYTIHLAAALAGTNIKVNSAHPGWVKTDLGSDGPTGKYIHLGNELPW